jgi:hypothetical protein
MATKTLDVVETKVEEITAGMADVHHMVRAVGPGNAQVLGEEVFSSDAVDAAVRNWLEAGYILQSTHYLGPVVDGARTLGYRILYIFVK